MTEKLKIFATTVEGTARAQIDEMNECEAYRDCTVRIMPDCHAGKGCTIGTVIEVKDRIVPNTVHNYIDTCSMILRKGAVDAWSGLLIIPMNMRDGSLFFGSCLVAWGDTCDRRLRGSGIEGKYVVLNM